MKIFYVGAKGADPAIKSIFLAGPSCRNKNQEHWRPGAITLLQELGYDGHVFSPLTEEGDWLGDYTAQTEWELQHLEQATCILFWIPRNIESGLCGFTTNVEFGLYAKSNKVILGYPHHADKMKYLHLIAEKNNIPIFHTLKDTLTKAIQFTSSKN
jgi:hypothetical protein